MKNPLVFLLQFVAWLLLFAVLLATWAGVSYPHGRAKAYSPAFSMIHPMCLHRIFIDEQYEGVTKLELCHAEYKNYPIHITDKESELGQQKQIEVTATAKHPNSGKYTVGYKMERREQTGSFVITLFHRLPDGSEISGIAGLTHDPEANTLTAHFLQGGNDRCHGGFIEVMGIASVTEIAYSQAATPYLLMNPLSVNLQTLDQPTQTTFSTWFPDEPQHIESDHCVGRLISTYDHLAETSEIAAVAVDLYALLLSADSELTSCVADAIVRTTVANYLISGKYTVYAIEDWFAVLYRVHQRCGAEEPFRPFKSGIYRGQMMTIS
jgi:hypothetical protein